MMGRRKNSPCVCACACARSFASGEAVCVCVSSADLTSQTGCGNGEVTIHFQFWDAFFLLALRHLTNHRLLFDRPLLLLPRVLEFVPDSFSRAQRPLFAPIEAQVASLLAALLPRKTKNLARYLLLEVRRKNAKNAVIKNGFAAFDQLGH